MSGASTRHQMIAFLCIVMGASCNTDTSSSDMEFSDLLQMKVEGPESESVQVTNKFQDNAGSDSRVGFVQETAGLPTDKCTVGHVFSDDTVRAAAPTTCACFYDKLFFENDVQQEVGVDFAPDFNKDPDPKTEHPYTHTRLLMDIWKTPPSLGLRPAIVLVHGGNCKYGSRSGALYQHLAKEFAIRGWVAASIDYRLLSTQNSCRTPGSIEGSGSDAKAAVRYLEANSDRLMIDPNRIVIMGCSAGGRTSMYAAFVQGNGVEKRPGGKWKNSQDNSKYPAKIAACVELAADFYAPNEMFPLIKSTGPPLMIFHYAKDPLKYTKCSVAETNYEQAVAAGLYVEKYIIPDDGHCPKALAKPQMDRVMNFLYKVLSLKLLDCSCSGMKGKTFKSLDGPNTACRGAFEGGSNNWPNYYETVMLPSPHDIEDCKALCYGPSCFGIEYYGGSGKWSGRCELWKVEIKSTAKVDGYSCFVKEKTSNAAGLLNQENTSISLE